MFSLQQFPLCSLLACLALTAVSFGETVVLKSGEKIEGKILSETDTQVTIEVVAGGVVDERTIAKADVASMAKVQPDETAWQPLQSLKPAESSFPTAAQYEPIVEALRGFAKQFPESKYKADAEKALADFEAEKTRVADGELKLNGRWLSKDEVQREKFQVGATVAANYMKTQAARNDLIGALNSFDLVEKQFEGTFGYIEAVAIARQILPTLQTQVAQRLAALPAENAAREKGVKASAGLEQIQLQKELDAEKKANDAALADAKKRGVKWPPFLRRSTEGMKQLASLIDETSKRLAALDLPKLTNSLKLAEDARVDLSSGDLKAAEQKLRDAQQAWPKNEIAIRASKQLAQAKEAAAAAPAEEAPKATPAPATPTPKPAPTAGATPKTAKPADSSASSSSSTPASAAETEEEKPVNWLLIIVSGVLLLIVGGAGWIAYRKVIKKSNEIIE